MTAQTFWSLVAQDLKGHKRRKSNIAGKWWIAYKVAVALVVVAMATYGSLYGKVTVLNAFWFFTWGLVFTAFGLGNGFITREWKIGTVGWWLALPLPRWQLVLSKYLACLIRTAFVFAIVYVIIALLGLYMLLMQGSWNTADVISFLLTGLKWNALMLGLTPIAGAFGLLMGAVGRSTLRPALPLLWALFGGGWWAWFMVNGRAITIEQERDGGLHLVVTWAALYPYVASFILAGLMIALASYIFARHVEL
ncbi:MAG: ABC transporter permease subunit [Alicyclobacillaceae bacterium]|nr:ABC transporter permease subunit [Alicyclobacillaceae bacterium]